MTGGVGGDDGAFDVLVDAAEEGDLELLRAMVEASGVNVNVRGRHLRTALMAAANKGTSTLCGILWTKAQT